MYDEAWHVGSVEAGFRPGDRMTLTLQPRSLIDISGHCGFPQVVIKMSVTANVQESVTFEVNQLSNLDSCHRVMCSVMECVLRVPLILHTCMLQGML
jgi:hypothetical protein